MFVCPQGVNAMERQTSPHRWSHRWQTHLVAIGTHPTRMHICFHLFHSHYNKLIAVDVDIVRYCKWQLFPIESRNPLCQWTNYDWHYNKPQPTNPDCPRCLFNPFSCSWNLLIQHVIVTHVNTSSCSSVTFFGSVLHEMWLHIISCNCVEQLDRMQSFAGVKGRDSLLWMVETSPQVKGWRVHKHFAKMFFIDNLHDGGCRRSKLLFLRNRFPK